MRLLTAGLCFAEVRRHAFRLVVQHRQLPLQVAFRRLAARGEAVPPARPVVRVHALRDVQPDPPRQRVHRVRLGRQYVRHPAGLQQRPVQLHQLGQFAAGRRRQLHLGQVLLKLPELLPYDAQLRGRIVEVRPVHPLRRGDQRARAVQPRHHDRASTCRGAGVDPGERADVLPGPAGHLLAHAVIEGHEARGLFPLDPHSATA
ncbi:MULTISPECIES: hypothetical protein [unclassified Streptomyces]|uniref:hypothetical protein n=1 Tax=unclassified Streptomyces TaxID=2593676 RepID=UPI001BE5C6D6|nr:hypothetical protein [Streptomyces sp. ISL-21]MBT2612646.1 hypothetical protein [Streptomyces sp. ISL-87]